MIFIYELRLLRYITVINVTTLRFIDIAVIAAAVLICSAILKWKRKIVIIKKMLWSFQSQYLADFELLTLPRIFYEKLYWCGSNMVLFSYWAEQTFLKYLSKKIWTKTVSFSNFKRSHWFTKTSNHAISISEKLCTTQFYRIPYAQKLCKIIMISIFPFMKNVWYAFFINRKKVDFFQPNFSKTFWESPKL